MVGWCLTQRIHGDIENMIWKRVGEGQLPEYKSRSQHDFPSSSKASRSVRWVCTSERARFQICRAPLHATSSDAARSHVLVLSAAAGLAEPTESAAWQLRFDTHGAIRGLQFASTLAMTNRSYILWFVRSYAKGVSSENETKGCAFGGGSRFLLFDTAGPRRTLGWVKIIHLPRLRHRPS